MAHIFEKSVGFHFFTVYYPQIPLTFGVLAHV